MTVKLKLIKKPEMKEPIMVCGMPGSGYVGKLAVDYLTKELKGELICEVYCDAFPPVITIRPDGTAEPMKNEIYYCRDPSSSLEILTFTGATQPVTAEGEYEVAEKVLEFAQKLNVKDVYTMGAYILGAFVEKSKVYVTATDATLLNEMQKHGAIVMKDGNITGMNGLLFALAKLNNMRGMCLLAETSGYIVDAKASEAALDILAKFIGLKLDMTALRDKANETEQFIKRLEESQKKSYARQSGQSLGYIS